MLQFSAETQDWLTKSIPGILTIGAVGSVLGALVWSLAVRAISWLFARHVSFLFVIMLPFGKRIEAASELRSRYKNLSPATHYSLYFLFRATHFLMVLSVWLSLVATTILIYVVTKFSYAWLLATMAALVFYFAFRLLKMYSYLDALQFEEVEKMEKEVVESLPKSYADWKKRILHR